MGTPIWKNKRKLQTGYLYLTVAKSERVALRVVNGLQILWVGRARGQGHVKSVNGEPAQPLPARRAQREDVLRNATRAALCMTAT